MGKAEWEMSYSKTRRPKHLLPKKSDRVARANMVRRTKDYDRPLKDKRSEIDEVDSSQQIEEWRRGK